MTARRLTYKLNDDEKLKYTHIVTHDEGTTGKGYGHCYILIKHPKQNWGFHLIWMYLGGELRSASAAMPVTLGRHKITEFGQQVIGTFHLVMARDHGDEHILGNIPALEKKVREWNMPWLGIESMNGILNAASLKMWDLDVSIVEQSMIPPDVLSDYRIIFRKEFLDNPKPRV